MIQYACRYPDGLAGVALLLMRLCGACTAVGVAAMLAESVPPAIVYSGAITLACLLAIGLATRPAALVLAIAAAVGLVSAGPVQQMLLIGVLGVCTALLLVGPGAFSIDARRHGRRVIRLQARPPVQADDR